VGVVGRATTWLPTDLRGHCQRGGAVVEEGVIAGNDARREVPQHPSEPSFFAAAALFVF
jgi:hypothetical protein